jgi:hypothetical protein
MNRLKGVFDRFRHKSASSHSVREKEISNIQEKIVQCGLILNSAINPGCAVIVDIVHRKIIMPGNGSGADKGGTVVIFKPAGMETLRCSPADDK